MESTVEVKTINGMICASFWGYGKEPESAAWAKLKAWAVPMGMYGDFEKHPIFGFDNPNPARFSFDKNSKSVDYGYEYIIKMDERITPTSDAMRVVELKGGLYAMAHMPSFKQYDEIKTYLMNWPENHGYKKDPTRKILEQHVSENEKGETGSLNFYWPILPLHK